MARDKKKKTGKSLVKWDEQFANLAKKTSKAAKVSEGKFISFQGGRMSFAGADIPDDELRCVIVGWCYHNVFYDPSVRYDPKNPQSPICWGFADTPPEDGEMEPLDTVPDKQCDTCAECPHQQWESAKQGKGKACKNTIRLALIAEDDLDDLSQAEVVFASIPPKSLKNWLRYAVDMRDKVERPLWSVITLLTREPDDESQFRLTFKNEEEVDEAHYEELDKLWDATAETINFPYVVREGEAKSSRGSKRGKKDKAPERISSKKQKFARK